jgi:hypothetical protein
MPRRAIPTSHVCRATTSDGRRYAVKYGLHPPGPDPVDDPIATEWAALTLLAGAGLQAPDPVGYDPDARVFVTQWVGGPTVDDALQRGAPLSVADVSACLRHLSLIEERCTRDQDWLAPYARPRDDAALETEFGASVERAREAYYVCLDSASALEAPTVAHLDRCWEGLWRVLVPRPAVLASADVNARNIVLSDRGPFYLDFSSLGWDWPERRAACYLTSQGSNHQPGRVACAVSAPAIEACGYSEGFLRRSEGHAFVLACLAIARMMVRRREGEMPTWQDMDDPRTASARELLALGCVADMEPTATLRREAARAFGM